MNILIIQILRMGDALQLIPVIKGIKQHFPHANLSMLTSRLEAQIFRDVDEIDKIYIMDKESICEQILKGNKEHMLKAVDLLQSDLEPLLEITWDWVINFGHTFSSALLSYLLNAKHRSGYFGTKDRRFVSKEKWFAYSLASFVNRRYSSFNWVDINSHVVGIKAVPHPPYLKPKITDLFTATGLLKEKGFENGRIIGLQPGASGEHKMWPLERFGQLGRALVKKHGYKTLIFGGEDEKELGARLHSLIGEGSLNLAGKTTVSKLRAYQSVCDALVTNDTGPMHLASSVGTPTIALFFSTHFMETGPYGEDHVVIHPDISCFPCQGTAKCPHKNCLGYISPETVERVIIHRSRGMNRIKDPLLTGNERVKVYYSCFDPWGFLDWIPLDKRPVVPQDLERLALKLALLFHSGAITDSEKIEGMYISDYLTHFSISENGNGLIPSIQSSIDKLYQFKELIKKASLVSLNIQSELIEKDVDTKAISPMGESLVDIEEEISAFDQDSPTAFLSELLEVFRENIEQSDYLSLSTKTVDVFRSIMNITDGTANRLKNIEEVLACYT